MEESSIFNWKPGPGNLKTDSARHVAQTGPRVRNLEEYMYFFQLDKDYFVQVVERRKDNLPVTVLDLMCGAGYAVMDLNNIVGIVAYGIDKVSYTNWHNNTERFICTDVRDLSFIKDNSFDIVLNVCGIFNQEVRSLKDTASRKKAFEESLRVLKKGGVAFYFPYAEPPVCCNSRTISKKFGQREYKIALVVEAV